MKEITRARIEGKVISNTNLELKVNRMYQEGVIHIKRSLEEARKRAEIAEDKTKEREKELIAIKSRDIRKEALSVLIRHILFNLGIALVVFAIVFLLYWLFFERQNKQEIIRYILSVLAFLIMVWKRIPLAYSQYRKTCKQSEEIASKKA